MADNDTNNRSSGKQGFASMDPQKREEISRKGGESVPPEERSFSKDRDLASEAGRKGGEASHRGSGGSGSTGSPGSTDTNQNR